MSPTKTELRVARCAERALEAAGSVERRASSVGERFLTREELAGVLKVSVRTVDEMVAVGELTALRPGGVLVRFYLPDVVRELTAAAVARAERLTADMTFTNCREKAQKTQGTERTKGL